MSDMQFCTAQVRAVKAKTDSLGISFSIGQEGVLQTLRCVRFWSAEQKATGRRADCGLMACRFAAQFLGLGAAADNAPIQRAQLNVPRRIVGSVAKTGDVRRDYQ